ncbi:RNA polymerase sigma factor [Enhygromyxa salina]|uniref:RNA polymerase sigma factor n=1 Tax=Enhygromyxa salina TaxID=215803 RepID=UPI0015E615AC|nr:sigma-70 family RNA polymerase sigma factor [Enhygromyxa salina]
MGDRGGTEGCSEGATVHRLHPKAPERATAAHELLARARRHDPAAQRELFELHKVRVTAQIQRMTGDPAAVDDLVQEVFIAAFGSLARFRGDSELQTWLYRIAANKVRNWWDSDRRRRRREQQASQVPQGSPPTPHDELETREHRERLYEALGQLSPRLREAFVARAIEGMSLHEASAALEVPISTVSYRARRAEALLCQALEVFGPSGEEQGR